MQVWFCSVNFRLLLFYCTNKLVNSYLLHIFIWFYIFCGEHQGWAEAQRLCTLFNTAKHFTLSWSSGQNSEHHEPYFIIKKSVTCSGRSAACPQASCQHRSTIPLSSSFLYWLLLDSARYFQLEDQIVPKESKPLGVLHERNVIPHLVTLKKTSSYAEAATDFAHSFRNPPIPQELLLSPLT